MRNISRRVLDRVRDSLQPIAHGPRTSGVVDRAAESTARGTDYAADGAGDAADCCAQLCHVSFVSG